MIIRDAIPKTFRINETVAWRFSHADYPASAGWTLKYAFRGRGGAFDVLASADGDGFLAVISSSLISSIEPKPLQGLYLYEAYISKNDERYVVDSGEIRLTADLEAQEGAFDGRSHVQKVLDAIEAVLERRATHDQLKQEVNGVRIERMPVADLMMMRARYKAEVAEEKRRKSGKSPFRPVRMRFLND